MDASTVEPNAGRDPPAPFGSHNLFCWWRPIACATWPVGMRASGRYAASCESGHCALTGNQATSKLEGQLSILLDHVFGARASSNHLRAGRGCREPSTMHSTAATPLWRSLSPARWRVSRLHVTA
jgi:hypothetical protein